MARRRGGDEDGVSLFPFLSILACVIGVLTLLISALSLAQINDGDVAIVEEYENTVKLSEEQQAEIDELLAKIADRRSKLGASQEKYQELLDAATDDLLAALAMLEKEKTIKVPEPPKPPKPVNPTDDKIVKQEILAIKEAITKLKEQIAQLEKQIADKNKPPEESQVTVLPSGTGKDLNPFFVECSGSAIVLHTSAKLERIARGGMRSSEPFRKVLEDAKNKANGTVIFLVRSDALSTYYEARNIANEVEVRNGKLPVMGKGRIDLSYFYEKK